jgi:hypothetical protein
LVDWAADAAALTPRRAPGSELFLEHVHYSFEGNFRLARRLAEFIWTEVEDRAWDAGRELPVDELRGRLRVSPEDEVGARSFALQMTQGRPFADALDGERHARFLSDDIGRRFQSLTAEEQSAFASLSMVDIFVDVPSALARLSSASGQADRALEWQETAALRRPWDADLRAACAATLITLNRLPEAQEQVERGERLDGASEAVAAVRALLDSNVRRSAP